IFLPPLSFPAAGFGRIPSGAALYAPSCAETPHKAPSGTDFLHFIEYPLDETTENSENAELV
ncbi:TPA: hypothetical protein ACFOXD_000854, partial [Neisseria meningitidis]